jgi:hypothetical protein
MARDRAISCWTSDDDDDDVNDDDHERTARKIEDDANTNAYETGTDYEEEEEEEADAETYDQRSNAYDTATYGGEANHHTNAYDTRYDNVADEVEDYETQGYETQDYETNLDRSHHNKERFTIGKSLRRGLEGLRYGNFNRLYQTTDESSVGSGMDQSHIYLMMTSARRQRNIQQRTMQQRGGAAATTTSAAKMGVEPHHSQWMSQARPQIITSSPSVRAPTPPPPPEHTPFTTEREEAARRNSFLDVRFVNDFMQGIINTNHSVTATTTEASSRPLKLQATKAIQDRWIREIQMAMATAHQSASDQERQRAAQEALARIREDYGRRQSPPQNHHFRLSTSSNNLYGAGGI